MTDASLIARVEQIAAKVRPVARYGYRGGYRPFGGAGRLWPPLTEQQVSAFETRHGIELPAEYREFITRVGDGGLGPAYGMCSLERALTLERHCPVPDDFLRTPFPHVQAYNPYEDPDFEPFWRSVGRGEISEAEGERRELYETAGTLGLCHLGCGHLHFLVVTGPARGQMWYDGRCSDQGLRPLGVGFLDWYERWLDSTLAGGDGLWWHRGPKDQPRDEGR